MGHLLSQMLVGASILTVGYVTVGAQAGEKFRARLSIAPVDLLTARTISGAGSVDAVLVDDTLFITGTFDGMSSPAAAAHLHLAPKGRRGPVVFELSAAKSATGVLGGRVELTEAQLQELRDGRYYVQVHTETNPDGEIRGWLLKEEF